MKLWFGLEDTTNEMVTRAKIEEILDNYNPRATTDIDAAEILDNHNYRLLAEHKVQSIVDSYEASLSDEMEVYNHFDSIYQKKHDETMREMKRIKEELDEKMKEKELNKLGTTYTNRGIYLKTDDMATGKENAGNVETGVKHDDVKINDENVNNIMETNENVNNIMETSENVNNIKETNENVNNIVQTNKNDSEETVEVEDILKELEKHRKTRHHGAKHDTNITEIWKTVAKKANNARPNLKNTDPKSNVASKGTATVTNRYNISKLCAFLVIMFMVVIYVIVYFKLRIVEYSRHYATKCYSKGL